MRIRPYIESKDYKYLEKWIDSERIHALWCANQIPYPVSKEGFHDLLEKNAAEYGDSAFVATEDNGEAVGFFCYSVNVEDNTGFLKFIIVDGRKRGAGYGKKMLQLAVRYAFLLTGAESVGLNVFEENSAAKHCYESVGFIETSTKKDIFTYNNESWGRCRMTVGKPVKAGSYA